MWKHVRSEKALKTYGWAVISGFIFFGSGLVAGAEVLSLLVATGTAVALKTPFYWMWEHAFEALWGKPQEPKEYLKLGNATALLPTEAGRIVGRKQSVTAESSACKPALKQIRDAAAASPFHA